MQRRTPRAPKASEDREEGYVAEFRTNLRRIAIRLAHHQKSSIVDLPHLDEAFNALCRIGILRQPWWKRPEFDTTLGGVFVGAAFAAPDVLPVVCDAAWLQRYNVTLSVFIVSFSLAAIFFVKGWMKSARPS